MGYAEVAVNAPATIKTFSYAIPLGLSVSVGQAVWAPFGNRLLQGIVLELTDTPAVEETRELAGVIEEQPLLSHRQISLARWLSSYYLSPLFEAVALMLPPGFERKTLTFVSAAKDLNSHNLSSLSEKQRLLLEILKKRGEVPLAELGKTLGRKETSKDIPQMARLGLITRSYRLQPVRVNPQLRLFLQLSVSKDKATNEIATLIKKGAMRQAALLGFLTGKEGLIPWAEVREKTGCNRNVLNALVKKGLIELKDIEVKREPISYENIIPSTPPTLTDAQKHALDAIKASLEKTREGATQPDIFLLHGVTGSGKTEIYLQSLVAAMKLGKKGIVLVPEISLTPQTIERFAARFPHKVAVLHSKLSLGEQFDEWQGIRKGEFEVVIGPRSAIFAPQPDLGLIIIDEEHEWTYKEKERPPYYHTRDVAMKLAELTHSVVIMGSATPDVATYYQAQGGRYHLLSLPERVRPYEGSPLPRVQIVDMREELKRGNRNLLSRALGEEIAGAVLRGEQLILFLNRRGAATFIQCRNCGLVLYCRRCQVALTYHSAGNILICHQCNYRTAVPQFCSQCHSRRISFFGAGIQKLEQEAKSSFPEARLLRWDSDTTRGKHSHEVVMGKLCAHEVDILIGTQMVASGLDLPTVTLVGVVSADLGLNLPDFRAGERTFQLLSQVAGRAGRGEKGGKVIIQTYSPNHYAIQAAARHDYNHFFAQEIEYRRRLTNPPFSHLISLTFSHTNNTTCQREAVRLKRLIIQERDTRGIPDLSIIGPAPAYIQRLRGRFRWQLILRSHERPSFLSALPVPRGWRVDVDPVGLT